MALLCGFLKIPFQQAFFSAVFIHDIAFVTVFLMLLVHVYLGIIHPKMTESLRSMWDGKISKSYTKHYYGKWYEEISKNEE